MKAKHRIRENIWGGWYGYLGTRRVADLGNKFDAEYWLKGKQADPSKLIPGDFDYKPNPDRKIKLS